MWKAQEALSECVIERKRLICMKPKSDTSDNPQRRDIYTLKMALLTFRRIVLGQRFIDRKKTDF